MLARTPAVTPAVLGVSLGALVSVALWTAASIGMDDTRIRLAIDATQIAITAIALIALARGVRSQNRKRVSEDLRRLGAALGIWRNHL